MTGARRESNRKTRRLEPRSYDRLSCGYIGSRLEYEAAGYIYEAVSPDYIAPLSRYGVRL